MKNSNKTPECYVIGIDCGSLSARALIARVSDGAVISESAADYPHGILDKTLPNGMPIPEHFVLQVAEDYLQVIPQTIREAVEQAGVSPNQIIGIGVDATSCTLVACTGDGTPLSTLPTYMTEPHCYIKLWKYHHVQKQVDDIYELARKRKESFLAHFGGTVSCEWMLPKVMQVYDENRQLFDETAYYLDLCDWLTWNMTGSITRSRNSAGFKNLWDEEKGDISREFLDGLRPGLGDAYYAKVLAAPVVMHGQCCGVLDQKGAAWLGLPEGIPVSAGMMDGHASLIATGLQNEGDMAIIVGTSNGIPVLSDTFREIPGVSGVVRNALVSGKYAYAAGQIATGDMLDWFVRNSVPCEYRERAELLGMDIHAYLSQLAAAEHPEKNSLTVLDWWNGNRSILCDQQLTGTILGLTLDTRPEQIYCAMLQGIACGTRVIMEQFQQYGQKIHRVFACGGIPRKNRFFMQQYANILNMQVYVVNYSNTSALGSAICAAAAAGLERGGYGSLEEAMRHMRMRDLTIYQPQREYAQEYENQYQRYRYFHDLLGNAKYKRTAERSNNHAL